jgi:dolichol-phosphate mannosyltransferase
LNFVETTREIEKNGKTEIAVVIPALNEEKSISKVLDQINISLVNYNYRILVVDGHSKDKTAIMAANNGATVIFQYDRGYGDALFTGFHYVKKHFTSEIVVMLDGDLTYSPKDIPRLLKPILEKEADFVIGNRFGVMDKDAMPLVNRIGNKILSWVARQIMGVNIHDTQCGIRAFKTELIDTMFLLSSGMSFATEMLSQATKIGMRIKEIPVNYQKRVGESKLNPIIDGLGILFTILRLKIKDF